MGLHGIDISKWQSTTPSLSGVDFVIARASIGLAADSRYAMHRTNVRAAGLPFAAYHFGDNRYDVREQARFAIATAGDCDGLALDVEGTYAFSIDQTRAFIDECHRAGRRCGLYMSLSGYYADAGQDWRWVAYWADKAPAIPWDVWQYRGSPLDLDYFDGTRDELLALWQGDADMIDPTRHLPIALCTVAPGGTVYADPDRKATLIPTWGGASNVGLYAKPVDPTASPVPLVPIRIAMGSGSDPRLTVAWVGWDKVTLNPDPTPISQAKYDADVAAARSAGYVAAKKAATSAVQNI